MTTPISSNDNTPSAFRLNTDWVPRVLSGVLLGLFTLAVVALSPAVFAVVLALAMILAAREWHRCVGAGPVFTIEVAITAATVALSAAALLFTQKFWPGAMVALVGAVASFVVAQRRNSQPLWHAFGTLYLSIPVLALVSLRAFPPHGPYIVIGLLFIIWATDTGALICGKLIGGPRMAPKLSPGKTWAGTIGGSIIAALVFAAYVGSLLGGSALLAGLFAFCISFVAHGGDLFESFVKRRFGLKDTGTVIPGHGGVLDRIDSTLAAAPVLALLVFVGHLDPLFGVAA